MSAFPTSGNIIVDTVEYSWAITRWGGASNAYENYRGLAVSVTLPQGQTKALIVEFPFAEFMHKPPQSKAVFLDRLHHCIEAALESGWVPTKRGKPFIYVAPETS